MFRSSKRHSSRALIALAFGGATLTAAGAATYHRLAVVQTTGSGGSTEFLQNGTGSALQGEVASSANTSIKYPFGVLGEFDPSGSTFGVGTLGISTTGYGVAGESLSNSQPSILAFPGAGGIGLEAVATSGSPAIFATNTGMGYGIEGSIKVESGLSGVIGEDTASPQPNYPATNSGVIGSSSYGTGVFGIGTAGSSDGILGSSQNGVGVLARSYGNSGGIALEAVDVGGGEGIESLSGESEALFASTQNANAALFENASDADVTLELSNTGEGDVIEALGSYGSLNLDASGDLTISGAYTSDADNYERTQNPSTDVMSYGAQTTEPTIEDVGSGRLTNGATAVSLAGDFRQTIDGSNYLVFITPDGPNHGLYVASKSPTGFVVRENDGGHSTLAFDYRIVAQRYGRHEGRLPHFASIHPKLTKERLAKMRSDSLERFNASRAKIAVEKRRDALMRAAILNRHSPQPISSNPFPVSFSKR